MFAQRRRIRSTADFTIVGTAITTTLSFTTGDLLSDYQTIADAHNITGEIPTGSGTTFILANTPVGSIELYDASGERMHPTDDFTIVGTTITTVLSWNASDLIVDYRI